MVSGLNPLDKPLWEAFLKYRTNIIKIIGTGVLDIRNGTFTCHLDGAGNIKAIDKQERVVL